MILWVYLYSLFDEPLILKYHMGYVMSWWVMIWNGNESGNEMIWCQIKMSHEISEWGDESNDVMRITAQLLSSKHDVLMDVSAILFNLCIQYGPIVWNLPLLSLFHGKIFTKILCSLFLKPKKLSNMEPLIHRLSKKKYFFLHFITTC